jgi:hypothetical protein
VWQPQCLLVLVMLQQQAEGLRTTKAGPASTAAETGLGRCMPGHWRLSIAGQGQLTAAGNGKATRNDAAWMFAVQVVCQPAW